jgi:hypothetical protein
MVASADTNEELREGWRTCATPATGIDTSVRLQTTRLRSIFLIAGLGNNT